MAAERKAIKPRECYVCRAVVLGTAHDIKQHAKEHHQR